MREVSRSRSPGQRRDVAIIMPLAATKAMLERARRFDGGARAASDFSTLASLIEPIVPGR